MPDFEDKYLPCKFDFCSGTVLWEVRHQYGQWMNAGTLDPPQWACSRCKQELNQLSERNLACSLRGCGGTYRWTSVAQLRSARLRLSPPAHPLCPDHKAQLERLSPLRVPCTIDGCTAEATVSPIAQLKAAHERPDAPLRRMCDECLRAVESLRPLDLPCSTEGCAAKAVWTVQGQRSAFLRGLQPPKLRCEACREFNRLHRETAVPCKYSALGCTHIIMIQGFRRRSLELSGQWPHEEVCDRCRDLERSVRDESLRCIEPGCEQTWLWKASDQLARRIQGLQDKPRDRCLLHRMVNAEPAEAAAALEPVSCVEGLAALREAVDSLLKGQTGRAREQLRRVAEHYREEPAGRIAAARLTLLRNQPPSVTRELLEEAEERGGRIADVLLARLELAFRERDTDAWHRLLGELDASAEAPPFQVLLGRARAALYRSYNTPEKDSAVMLLEEAYTQASAVTSSRPDVLFAQLIKGQAARMLAIRKPENHNERWIQAADDALRRAIEEPDQHQARAELADLLLRQGRRMEAEQRYREVLVAMPDHVFATRGLLRLLMSGNRHAEARPLAEHLYAALKPSPADVAVNLAACLRLTEPRDLERAAELLEDLLERDGATPAMLLELARVYLAMGDYRSAHEASSRAAGLGRDWVGAKASELAAKARKDEEARRRTLRATLLELDRLPAAELPSRLAALIAAYAHVPYALDPVVQKCTALAVRTRGSPDVSAELHGQADEAALLLLKARSATVTERQQAAHRLLHSLEWRFRNGRRAAAQSLFRAIDAAIAQGEPVLSPEQRDVLARARSVLEPQRIRRTSGPTIRTAKDSVHAVTAVKSFLDHLIEEEKLPIAFDAHGQRSADAPLWRYGPDPTFLVAMTGVGKTLTIPLRELLLACERRPPVAGDSRRHVYIVEPRIPICEGMQRYLDGRYRSFCRSRHLPSDHALFGCITSATGQVHAEAPILFITTGILESLVASESLDPDRDRVVIDEAHVTIEQNPGVELCIALLRRLQVPLSYMSATVDTAGLERELGVRIVEARNKRYPVLLRLLDGPIDRNRPEETAETLERLVSGVLLEPDPALFAPVPDQSPQRMEEIREVRRSLVDEAQRRAVGMLIVVNSHASEHSDTRVIADLIRNASFNRPRRCVEVLRLASPIIRDAEAFELFKSRIARIEAEKGRYVIVATNVVEMGVTFESVDIVVTLDSELETVQTPLGSYLRKRPLGVNALYQRAGRAGRKRPGACFIARDVGAAYTELDPAKLDSELDYEPLRYPFQTGGFQRLALASFQQKVENPNEWLRSLPIPSAIRVSERWQNPARARLREERSRLQLLGLADGRELTRIGRYATEQLVTLEDPRFVALIVPALEDERLRPLLEPLLVIAAAADVGLSDIVRPSPEFRFNGQRVIRHEVLGEDDLGILPSRARQILEEHGPDPARLMAGGMPAASAARLVGLIRRGYTFADLGQGYAQDQQERYLILENEVVRLSRESDLVSVYRIVAHFYNQYLSMLFNPLASPFDRHRLRTVAEIEAAEAGIELAPVEGIVRRYRDLRKRLSTEASRETKRPHESIAHEYLVSAALDACEERADSNDWLSGRLVPLLAGDLARAHSEGLGNLFAWTQAWTSERNVRLPADALNAFAENLVQPMLREIRSADNRLMRAGVSPQLPGLARRGLDLLHYIEQSGAYERFTLEVRDEDCSTLINDGDGGSVPLVFRLDDSPLKPIFRRDPHSGTRTIDLLGRPRLVQRRRRDEGSGESTFPELILTHASVPQRETV